MKLTRLFLFLITAMLLHVNASMVVSQTLESIELSYEDIIRGDYISLDKLKAHILFFTQNCSPRITGYPGAYRAAEYIAEKFREFGLEDVAYHRYDIAVPIDEGGFLEVYSEKGTLLLNISVYPLWPNSVHPSATPSDGLKGSIFYVKKGAYEDYVGYNIRDAIVIMDFNSLDNWKKAMSLGAKAVVFLEPETTSIIESELKYTKIVPLNAPRVYIRKRQAERLLKLLAEHAGKLNARLVSRIKWEKREGINVIAYKTGMDLKDQWILLFAHYDSWSVVPAMAEGATDACGIAALLELARFYANVKTRRSIMFIAFSGYGEGIAGARNFVDRLLWEPNFTRALPDTGEHGKGIFLVIGMDLTPETDVVGMFYTSYFYRIYRMGVIGRGSFIRTMSGPFFEEIRGRLSFKAKMERAWRNIYGRTWKVVGPYSFNDFDMLWDLYTPTPFILDGDAFTVAQVRAGIGSRPGGRHFSYRTAYAQFRYRGTPLDTFSRLDDLKNLKPQLEFILCTTYDLLNLDLEDIYLEYKPEDILTRQKWLAGGYRFGRLTGQVVQFDVETGYYKPVPNAIVQVYASDTGKYYKHMWFEITNERGVFNTTGLGDMTYIGTYNIVAYVIDQSTGEILYAPDMGRYGSQQFPHTLGIHPSIGKLGSKEAPYPVVVFPCGTIEVFNLQDSQSLSEMTIEMSAMQWTAKLRRILIQVNDVRTHFETDHYGYTVEGDVAAVFTQPGIPTEIVVAYDRPKEVIGILHNATMENPEHGWGYKVGYGEILRLIYPVLHMARDICYLNEHRIQLSRAKSVFTGVEHYHEGSKKMCEQAQKALLEGRFDKYYVYAISSWSLGLQTHRDLRSAMEGVIHTTMSSFVLLLLFAFIAERLFLPQVKGMSRLMTIIGFLVTLLALLILFHPGFLMATNIFAVLIGIGIVTLTAPVLALVLSESVGLFKEWREKLSGKHIIGVSLFSATMSALSVGVSNMRKRKLRTALALTTLIIVTASIVMFTSTLGFKVVRPFRSEGYAYYTGIFIRDLHWRALKLEYIDYLKARFSDKALVLPRAWAYTLRPDKEWGGTVFGSKGEAYIRAYYGLTPAEGEVLMWSKYLTQNSRWFTEGDNDVCILTAKLASALGIKVGDFILAEGIPLRVIGIFDDSIVEVKELDQYISSPFDITVKEAEIDFIPPSQVIYVPYDWLIMKGGQPYSVVINFFNLEDVKPAAIKLASESGLQYYVAVEGGDAVPIILYSATLGLEMTGYMLAPIPLIISMMMVLDLMLGMIAERTREISVLSALGLSPLHVSVMFLSECIVLAIISTAIGYVAGIVGINVMRSLGLLPTEFYPNYASTFVFMVLSLMITAIILPSIYPLYKAGRLVTPSLERKWRFKTKPVGDKWTIPTPFFLTSEEVHGMFEYLKEYFLTYTEPLPGFPFAAEPPEEGEEYVKDVPVKYVSVLTHLAPFTLGVSQETRILAVNEEGRWNVYIEILRKTGKMDDWVHANKKFIDLIRKQLLTWRGLSPSERMRYMKRTRGE